MMICNVCAHRDVAGKDYLCDKCHNALSMNESRYGGDFSKHLKDEEFGKAMYSDNVEHPAHYTVTSIECIDAMIETQGVDAVKNFCICNAVKYLWRHNKKNGVEDVKKAAWYLNKYIDLEEKNDET